MKDAIRITTVFCIGSFAAACIPYTVGTTAHTAPVGEFQKSAVFYTVPNGLESKHDSLGTSGASIPGADLETRWGLDDRSDLGVRIPSMSGLVVSYKRRLDSPSRIDAVATAMMFGGGFVNWGQHAYVDATLITSGKDATVVPYGGLRVMQTIPLSSSAVSDSPTAGVFLGVRLGRDDVRVSPEIGVFYDESALGIRKRNVIFVPSISLQNVPFGRIPFWGWR